MKPLIESLESRRLLSASLTVVTQDAADLQTEHQTIRADLTAWQTKAHKDVKKLHDDIKKLKGRSGTKPLVKILEKHQHSGFHKLHSDLQSLLDVTIRDTGFIIGDLKGLLVHSTTALKAKLAADIAKYKQETSSLEAASLADAQFLQTQGTTDLNAISSSTPSTATDVATAKADLVAGLHTMMTDLTSLSNKLTKFATDAGA